MFLLALFTLSKLTASKTALLCGTGFDTCDENTWAEVKDDLTTASFVKKDEIDAKLADVTDLYIYVKSAETISIPTAFTGLANLRIGGAGAVALTLTLADATTAVTSLSISKVTVTFTKDLSTGSLSFTDTGALATEKKVTITKKQECKLSDAPKYSNVIFVSGSSLTINADLDTKNDNQITLKEKGLLFLGTELATDNLPSKFEIITKVTIADSNSKNVILSVDQTAKTVSNLKTTFTGIASPAKMTVQFDNSWASSILINYPEIEFKTGAKTDIVVSSPTKKASIKIIDSTSGSSSIFYQYPINGGNVDVEICLFNTGCASSGSAYHVDATSQEELTTILDSIEIAGNLKLLLKENVAKAVDLSSLKGKLTTFIISGETSERTVTISHSPKGIYSWKLEKCKVTLPTTEDTIIVKIDSNGDGSFVKEDKIMYEKCSEDKSTNNCLKDKKYLIYEYTIDNANLNDENYVLTFNPDGFLIPADPAAKEIKIGGNNGVNAKKVELVFKNIAQASSNGIVLKPSGTTAMNLLLTIKGIAEDSLPISFDSWDSVTNDVDVIISTPNDLITKVNIVKVPSKVTMTLQDDAGVIYDMIPIKTENVAVCIAQAKAGCKDFKETFVKGDSILYKEIQDSTEVGSLMSSLSAGFVKNFIIGLDSNLTAAKAIDLTKLEFNITSVSFNGISNDEYPIKVFVKTTKPTIVIQKMNLENVDFAIDGDLLEIPELVKDQKSQISGKYHISNIYTNEKQFVNYKKIESDRFYINFFTNKENILFDESSWYHGAGENIEEYIKITPGANAFTSKVVFLQFTAEAGKTILLKPKDSNIKTCLSVSINILEPKTSESPKSLADTTMTIKFDKESWDKTNISETFAVRIIGSEAVMKTDESYVPECVKLVLKDVMPSIDDDEKDMDPSIIVGETSDDNSGDETVISPKKKKGLNGGAIAGIVIACVVVVAGIVVGVVFYLKKKKARVAGGVSP